MDGERGSASVEHAALVLLAALVAGAVVALVAIGPERQDGSLAAAIAFKQRCAVRRPCGPRPVAARRRPCTEYNRAALFSAT